MISWSSLTEILTLAEQHGVPKSMWPIYGELALEVPLDEAIEKSRSLAAALETIPDEVVEEDYWLAILRRLLRQGNSFFVTSI
ncbi:MAG: hypothetical protein AAF799_09170 [Myxococcota bacterium]